ncbi:MAG: squalene/phytoene synthase family protein [Chloroflexi bacterium]|nr:squalene/phytoene synthase family protein [Chloroflexota bacterium]
MIDATAALARSITRSSSKQTYLTARLMVDKDMADDCFRAYAYFRWADDVVDVSSQSKEDRIAFISRQRVLIDRMYRNKRPHDLSPEEEMVTDLISHDKGKNSGLRSFIYNFLAVVEFDAHRKGRPINEDELTWYSSCLGKAVTDCIQYFIGHGHPYATTENRYLAATAAHITHMLRDMVEDTADGYINIPYEYLEAHDIVPEDIDSPPFRAWVRAQVEQAREYFREGKRYLDEVDVLRCKVAGYWYCARFEIILDSIEGDEYILRAEYSERHKRSAWLKMAWIAVSLSLRHVVRRMSFIRQCFHRSWEAIDNSSSDRAP